MPLVGAIGSFLDERAAGTVLLTGIGTILLIGVADTLTGPEIASSIFYLIPVGAIAWRSGGRAALFAGTLAGAVWLAADLLAGHAYSHPFIPLWNGLVRTSVFLVVGVLIAELRLAILHERELARTDLLTGLSNSRAFYELCGVELSRARRFKRPLTLIYVDCDDFKEINDRFGHAAGDHVLRVVARVLLASTRKIDTVARLGGDEFALLLPETGHKGAQVVCGHIQNRLEEQFAGVQPRITLSLGVACFGTPPATVDELIATADRLMYDVKRQGKNSVRYLPVPAGV